MSDVNTLKSNSWRYYFSNFPSVYEEVVDVSYFNNFVRSVTLPEFSVNYIESTVGAYTTPHAINMLNDYNPNITIEFQVNENMYNYSKFFNYFLDLKTGRISKNETHFIEHTIKYLRVELLDNQQQMGSSSFTIEFVNCHLVSLSSLSLGYGSSDILTFNVGLRCEEVKFLTGLINPQYELPNKDVLKGPGYQNGYNPL